MIGRVKQQQVALCWRSRRRPGDIGHDHGDSIIDAKPPAVASQTGQSIAGFFDENHMRRTA
jgi:hypothetical protein